MTWIALGALTPAGIIVVGKNSESHDAESVRARTADVLFSDARHRDKVGAALSFNI